MYSHKKNFESLEQVYLEKNFFEIFKILVKTKNIADTDERLKFVNVKQTLSSTENSELVDDNNINGLNNYNGLNKFNLEDGKLFDNSNTKDPNSHFFKYNNTIKNNDNCNLSGNVTDASFNFNTLRELYETRLNNSIYLLEQEKLKMANNINQFINSQLPFNSQYNNYISGFNPQIMNNMLLTDQIFNSKFGLLNQNINNNFDNAAINFYQKLNYMQNNNNNVTINLNNATSHINNINNTFPQGCDFNSLNQMYMILKNLNHNI